MPEVEIVEVPAAQVSLADAISSYLFNAQLVTPPGGEPTLILPQEARDTPSVWRWLQDHVAGNGPIRRLEVVDVRESMANGGAPPVCGCASSPIPPPSTRVSWSIMPSSAASPPSSSGIGPRRSTPP
ncbi:N-succinylarginine dihydrolase [Sphingomonas paucimobilis]|nr:N-succinylarginine dihydrolase [Sphingomonas paucimobilis]